MKYLSLIALCFVMTANSANAVVWCLKSYENLYRCANPTDDLDLLNFIIQEMKTEIREDTMFNTMLLLYNYNEIRKANVSGEDASDIESFYIGNSLSPQDDTLEAIVSGGSSDGSNADKTTGTLMAMMTRPDTTLDTIEAAGLTWDEYYIASIKQTFEDNFDAVRKLKEKPKVIETMVEASEQGLDYNQNIRFREDVTLMNISEMNEAVKLDARAAEFEIIRDWYLGNELYMGDHISIGNEDEVQASPK